MARMVALAPRGESWVGTWRREVAVLGPALAALAALTVANLVTGQTLVSTLGIIVVVAGLVGHPRTVLLVAGVAISCAVLLLETVERDELSRLRLGNVVIGSTIALGAALARQARLRQLQDVQQRDAALLASISDGILGLDATGSVTFANPAAATLLGADPVGRRAAELIPAAALFAGASDVERGPVRTTLEVDGVRRELELRGQPLEGEHGGQVLTVRDRTAEAADERERQRLLAVEAREREHARVLAALERALHGEPPAVPGAVLDVAYEPADAYAPGGGDLHDAFLMPDGSLHLLVVDVVGHGVEGVRDALRIVHLARALTLSGAPLEELYAMVDCHLAAPGEEPVMATAVAVRYVPGTGELRLAGAGHPPPLLVCAASAAEHLAAPGRPLGVPGAGSDGLLVRTVAPGQAVLLYTDGLVEVTRDIDAGITALARTAAATAAGASVPGWAESLLRASLGGHPRRDDSLLVTLART